jgi:hypothetical protein
MKNFKQALIIALTLIVSTAAQASIVCKVQTSLGPARIEIDGSTVKVTGAALKRAQVFKNTFEAYDGHATSLITAPGLSISFRNIYGCIRDAKVTTNFREDDVTGFIELAEAKNCSGGTTADNICQH